MADGKSGGGTTGSDQAARRLTPIDRSTQVLPWRRARELNRCFLYWLPVSAFPIPTSQRGWLMEFFARWTAVMKESGLRPETFLQYKTVYPNLMDPLINTMMEFIPIMGLGRKPGTALPKFPSKSEVERMTKKMFDDLKQEKPLDLPDAGKYAPEYTYWFLDKSSQHQRELFFGYGGLSVTFLKPDPGTVAPPLPITDAQRKKIPMLQHLDRTWAQANSMKEAFLAKSKEFFVAGLEAEPQMKGIPFILPLMDSSDFFSQPAEVVEKCFELFEVYVRESPADKGLLLSFKTDFEEQLVELLRSMKEEKLIYPEA